MGCKVDYDKFVKDTWVGNKLGADDLRDLFICTTGLAGEAGEVSEKLKKFVRDDTLDVDNLVKELGDVLYYLVTIGHRFGFSLEDIQNANVDKLVGRMQRGTMRGSGDNR